MSHDNGRSWRPWVVVSSATRGQVRGVWLDAKTDGVRAFWRRSADGGPCSEFGTAFIDRGVVARSGPSTWVEPVVAGTERVDQDGSGLWRISWVSPDSPGGFRARSMTWNDEWEEVEMAPDSVFASSVVTLRGAGWHPRSILGLRERSRADNRLEVLPWTNEGSRSVCE